MRKLMTALAMAAMLTAAPAVAQGHHGAGGDSTGTMGMMQGRSGAMPGGMMQGGMMQMMHGQQGMMGGGMMGAAMGPGMILRLQESLELTESQVAQLEALQDSASAEMRRHMMQGMQAMHGARQQVAPGSTDLEAYESTLREAASHMVAAHTAMARAGVAAREVLTAEQRDRLALARQMMMEMRGGMMGSGMMQGGMMGGGTASPDSAGGG